MVSSPLSLRAAGLVLLGLLGGCSSDEFEVAPLPQDVAQLCCYQTLGDRACYPQPQARDQGRLLGCRLDHPYPPVVSYPSERPIFENF